jgi:hypothetical protein
MSQLIYINSEHLRYELLFLGKGNVRLTFRNMPNFSGVTTTDLVTMNELEHSARQILDACALARSRGLETET